MRITSEKSLARGLDRWEALLAERASGEAKFADEIFAIADLLRGSASLNASLQELTRSADARATLAREVLGGKVSEEVSELVQGLVRDAWSELGDLAEALDAIGVDTLLVGAAREGVLHETEEQLYQFSRMLHSQRQLRVTLSDRAYDVESRAQLAHSVLGSGNLYTQALVAEAVTRTAHRPLTASVRDFVDAAAARANQQVASVVSVIPLSAEQEARLAQILGRMYETEVRLHTSIDPTIVGGLRIMIGDDVIDGTLATRLNHVRTEMTK
ncbi:F-type H+-transporting ATPase subunit delta [Arcanobacterium wilhelmae]|uniref:ATP synthase subunit delta n=1 Tax=Arcanobacterium wilhelmae TaxID=1803177 RepID=A0ABT9NAI4_9ACTO|nr:F0F1 ATP synthase subunit delta [Arcanobacterium wilhelmae]MDP9800505.1 F-type H+-transporting ATPase subunit delta [Arcanobacterium wilhelmae]WFN89924.1 F0F1 ATP synthase subunit delta [Arcanobacterium wilhelmae]